MDISAPVLHDADRHQFTLSCSSDTATLQYNVVRPGLVDFQSTWVPPSHRGRGTGARLVRHALDWARAEGYRVIPSCWFVGEFFARQPEYRDLDATDREGLGIG